MKIIFFGTGNYALPVIDELRKKNNVTVFTTIPEKEKLKKINAELAVVANFKHILPKEILDLFQKGVLNIHPSLLPKYRGATPGQSAILNGDKKTGVSIIKLDQEMDHGPILWQKKEDIKENDTAQSLYLRLFKIASEEIVDIINKYLENNLTSIPQEDKKASFARIVTRENGYIDSNNPPPQEILKKMIRAYYPWPGVWTNVKLNNKNVRIKLLPKNILQIEGKNAVSFKDFANGYPEGKSILRKLKLN